MEYPLSHGQRALWFLQQLTPETASYNLVHAVRIRSPLDIAVLQRALERLVYRHPALRTTFAERDGEPIQRVGEEAEVDFRVEDAFGWSSTQLHRHLAEEVYRPFDLERGPLLRVVLFTSGERDPYLVLSMHHTICDLWSLAVFMYELGVLYDAEKEGTPVSLREPRVSYADYVRQQSEMLESPEGERLWSFWQRELSGRTSTLDLPTDRLRPPVQTYRGSSESFRVGGATLGGLQRLCDTADVPLHAALLAAFQTLLHRYTDQEDILVGYPKAGRTARIARLIGYFVNPVILRADFRGDPTFLQLLTQVHQTILDVFEHDTYPFPLLVERFRPTRELSHSPLFQVMFAWQKTTRLVNSQDLTPFALNEPGGRMKLGSVEIESVALEDRIVPFDVSLLMAEGNEELAGLIEYNTDLFDTSTVTRMVTHFQTLLAGIAAHPDRPVSELPILSKEERQAVLLDWNATETTPQAYQSIPQLFQRTVEIRRNAVAVMDETEQVTYDELNRRANQLARYLRRLGVGPETVVGLLLERSIEAIVAMLAVLKADGAYLPLDPANPPERLNYILEDAEITVLLTQADLDQQVSRLASQRSDDSENRRVVHLDMDWKLIASESDQNLTGRTSGENLAYVIYTSGSTGRPKGVCISNQSISSHCRHIKEHFGLTPHDRVLQFAAYSFDQSVEQILATLITGATLVLRGPEVWLPTEFSQVVSDLGLTVVNLPPAYWHQWVGSWNDGNEQTSNDQLRLVISGGDVMQSETLADWWKTPMKNAALLNAYGPTETTITATTFEIEPGMEDDRIPIGRPGANRKAYILDPHGSPVPIGVAGELYLGGEGLARGYLRQPGLTAERFIPDPYSDKPGARLYRTGDLVRHRPDGNVEFLGRVDQQVKIRGFRIELDGIEAVLNQHPAVRQAVVLAREDTPGDKRLAAYIVPENEALETSQEGSPTERDLRAFLKERVPDYMVPSTFVSMDAFPVTSSGKIDRGALPAPEVGHVETADGYVAPRTPIEEDLAKVWAEVLGRERVGIHDDFFELGGHSLLATQIVSRARAAFQVDLPLRALFNHATVAGLAALIENSLIEETDEGEIAELLDELDGLTEEEVGALLGDGAWTS